MSTHGDALKPYQAFVEQMQQGAVSLSLDGSILYANLRFAEIVGRPLEKVIGATFPELAVSQESATALLKEAKFGSSRGEMMLQKPGHADVPSFVAIQRLQDESGPDLCMVVTDLTDIVAARLLT
ncbi:PAS domain S-box protein, partial [bacterium]